MFKNYILIVFRNLIKNRVFSIVNIFGLAVGMAACLLISTYVNYERSFDSFYEQGDDLYRVRYERTSEQGDKVQFASACPAVGHALKETFPEIESFARSYKTDGVISYQERFCHEANMFYAENEYLKLLSFNLLRGNLEKALEAPNTAVISEDIALKYFKNEDPLGKFIKLDNRQKFEIIGIFANRPENAHCKADILLSYATWIRRIGEQYEQSWFTSGFYTYVKLAKGTDPNMISSKFPSMIEKYLGEKLRQYKLKMAFDLQPVQDIHLTSHYMHELRPNGDAKTINFLWIIAYFIIVIAWVNFINLSTISYMKRAKEIGLRKVVGASRGQIILQFLAESVLINLIAVGLALLLLELLRPVFCQLSGIPEVYSMWEQSWFYVNLSGMFMVGVFLSGMYPVWGLTSAHLQKILKGNYSGSKAGLMLRKGLVLFQFAISILLIAGTFSVVRQINHMRKQDLGFQKDRVLVVHAPSMGDETLRTRRESFQTELMNSPEIKNVAFSSVVPGESVFFNRGGIYREGDDPKDSKNYRIIETNVDYFDLYEMEFQHGRGFSREFPSDKDAVVLNERSAYHMGFEDPSKAIGERIHISDRVYSIIGIVRNFHQQSPKLDFEPQIFRMQQTLHGYFSIKLNGNDMKKSMELVEKTYTRLFAGNPYRYFFLNAKYEIQYNDDKRFSKVFGVFAILALLITSLGLLSLSAFSANQRRKEIGVRKVMGASVQRLLLMLSKEYIILLGIATMVAVPLILWGLKSWLNGYANRMDIPVWLLIIPILAVGLISVVTISYQSYKTANQNPVDSIKSE